MAAREQIHEEQSVKLRAFRNTVEYQEGNIKALEAR